MAAPSRNPLTPAHKVGLEKVITATPEMIELAQACKDCGLPADEQIQMLEAQLHTATSIYNKFFPKQG